MKPILLIAGIPRAGKTTLAHRLESGLGLTHVPLDKYIMPVATGSTFLEWVRTPDCIDWSLLRTHLSLLFEGFPCHAPRMDWTGATRRVSEGGPNGTGQEMMPSHVGYAIPGTHAIAFPFDEWVSTRVCIRTPDRVLAERFAEREVPSDRVKSTLAGHIGDNDQPLRTLESEADNNVSGEAIASDQLLVVKSILRSIQ